MSRLANRPHHTNRESIVSHAVSEDGQSSHTLRPRAVLERAVSEDEMPQAGTTSQNSTTQTKPAASNKYSASRKDPTAHRDTRRFVDFVKEKRGLLVFSVILALLGVLCSIVPFLAAYGLLVMLWEGSANLPLILLFIAGGLVFFYARILLLYISTRRSHTAAFFVMEQLRIAITKKITRLPLGSTQEKGSGFYKNLLVDEIERLEYPMAHAIPETTSNTLLPLLVITTMYFFDWRLGLAMTLPVLLTLGLYIPAFRSIMAEFSRTYYAAADRMNARVIEYILGIKEVKIFNRVEDVYSHFVDSINHYEALTLRLYKRMWGVSSIAEVLLLSITAIIIAVGGLLFALGEIGLSVYLLAIFLSLGIGQPLLKFNEFLYNLFHISNGARMVDEVLALPELSQTASSSVPLPNYELSFRNVSFSYGNGQVLSEVSLLFPAGKKTALVGPSGSGKSTIANLAARFWDVGEGSITLGGVDIRALPLSQLMEIINYVTQDTFLFNISLRENIRLGRPNATNEQIEAAARAAQCEEFLSTLPEGLDTRAGNQGARLSGGQRQRIIIARAILRNAPLIILDEATAYADMENQHRIQQSLQELCREKTLIIIAHRLSTIVDCDQIVVIDRGRVEASGTHEYLLKTSNVYQMMWEASEESCRWSVNLEREQGMDSPLQVNSAGEHGSGGEPER